MKKKTRGERNSVDKHKPAQRSVDEYLASVQEPARSTLNKVRARIRSIVPAEATEAISYGTPAFKYKKVLLWYAAFSDHCSLFPTGSVVGKLKDELTEYRVSKGTIQFPVNKPLPAALLTKIVKARLADVERSRQRG